MDEAASPVKSSTIAAGVNLFTAQRLMASQIGYSAGKLQNLTESTEEKGNDKPIQPK